MAAFFARAFFEPALPVAAIGSNVVELAAAGSDWVGSAVGGSSVGSGFLITNVIFGQECKWMVHLATWRRAKGGNQ